MYAVIVSGGKQYKVSEGEAIRLEKLAAGEGERVEFDQVLLVRSDDQVRIGTPFVAGARVEGTVVRSGKSEKVVVFKFKRRKQYKRTRGHRQPFTEVRIEKIFPGS